MFKIWNAANFRRTVTAACLILAPLFFAAAELAGPEPKGNASAQLAAYAANRGGLLAASMFSIASALAFITALFGLLHWLRARGVVFGHLAGITMLYGLVLAHAALPGVNLVFYEMTTPGLDRAAMVKLLESLQRDKIGAPLLLGHFALVLGVILLGIALWRGGIGPRWAAICVILFPVADVMIGMAGLSDELSAIVSNLFGLLGFGALGIYLLRTSDDSWDGAHRAAPDLNTRQVAASV